MAGRIDITGAVKTVDTTVTSAVVEAAGAVAGVEATEAEAGVRRGTTVAEAGAEEEVLAAADAVAAVDVTGGEQVGDAAAC